MYELGLCVCVCLRGGVDRGRGGACVCVSQTPQWFVCFSLLGGFLSRITETAVDFEFLMLS